MVKRGRQVRTGGRKGEKKGWTVAYKTIQGSRGKRRERG